MSFTPFQIPVRDLFPAASENNGKSHSPNVINIDLDSDRGRNPVLTKNITMGELTDSIIAKDYSASPFLPLRQPAFVYRPESSVTYKLTPRMPQQKDALPPHSQPAPLPSQNMHSHHTIKNSIGPNSGAGRTTPDERQIIRMAQPPSPRTKSYHEPVTPPESYQYTQPPGIASRAAAAQKFALDCYVKNRIMQAMRTEDEKRAEELHDQQRRTPQQPQSHHNKDIDRSTPGEMVIDEESPASASSSSNIDHGHAMHHHPGLINSQFPQPPVTTFTTTTYAYPYSALNVSGTATNLPPPIKTTSSQPEPKPLLSAQYEALSDED